MDHVGCTSEGRGDSAGNASNCALARAHSGGARSLRQRGVGRAAVTAKHGGGGREGAKDDSVSLSSKDDNVSLSP